MPERRQLAELIAKWRMEADARDDLSRQERGCGEAEKAALMRGLAFARNRCADELALLLADAALHGAAK